MGALQSSGGMLGQMASQPFTTALNIGQQLGQMPGGGQGQLANLLQQASQYNINRGPQLAPLPGPSAGLPSYDPMYGLRRY